MNKRIGMILGLVVVAVVAFAVSRGYPPKGGTEGAIGAAKRYASEQINAGDVALQDADIQAFLQTDTFHRLATDARLRELARSEQFRNAVATGTVAQLVASPDAMNLIAASGFEKFASIAKDVQARDAAAGADLMLLVRKDFFASAIQKEQFRNVLFNKDVQAIASAKDFALLAADKNLEKVALQREYREFLAAAAMQKLADPKALDKLALEKMPNLYKSAEYQALATNPAYLALMPRGDFQRAFGQLDVAKTLVGQDFQALVAAAPSAMNLVASGDVAKIVGDNQVMQLVSSDLFKNTGIDLAKMPGADLAFLAQRKDFFAVAKDVGMAEVMAAKPFQALAARPADFEKAFSSGQE